MNISHKPFHQKYRPNTIDELVGQDFISITLKQALKSQKIAPAYLFNGPRGTGKTSSARIFAKSLNCLSTDHPTTNPCGSCELCKQISDGNALDIIEIDAASNTGVENIREIIERARFSPSQARWKVYVIDECHMLSTAASNALLKTIEEPPLRVVFILATTNPERVLTTIQSRCQKFDFKRISSNDIFKQLSNIAYKEQIAFEDQALKLISKRANGGMRDAQSILEQLSLLPDGISIKNVQNLLGEVSEIDLISLITALIENSPEALIVSCNKLYDAGNEPNQIIIGLLNITRDLLLNSINNKYSDLFYTSSEFKSVLNKFSNRLDKSKIIDWHTKLRNVEYQIKNSDNPRLWLEIHLTSLIDKFEIKKIPDQHIIKEDQNVDQNIDIQNKSSDIQKLRLTKNEISSKQLQDLTKSDSIENLNETNISSEIQQKNESNFLKDKWELFLSKVELPSTRMLLSQQAQLESFDSSEIVIALSPNWENMIKSRKVIIEQTAQKIFGNQVKVSFSSKESPTPPLAITKEKNITIKKNQSTNEIEPKKNFPQLDMNENSSKNLAKFFNGEIIDLDE